MYEVKKIGKVFTSKFVGAAVSQRLRNTSVHDAKSRYLDINNFERYIKL